MFHSMIQSMISGALQDEALLMVPANQGYWWFKTSVAKWNHNKVQAQPHQHARMYHLLDIEQLIFGVNKMDDKSVHYTAGRWNETEVEKMLTKIECKSYH